MEQHNVISIDLAKSSFHVYVINKNNQSTTNRSFSRQPLKNWLARQKPSLVALEACGSAHYWARQVIAMGHQVVLLPPKVVVPFRQGHKTDERDARAIAIAARQPDLKTVAVKTLEQQGLQGIERIREHWSDHLTATGNLIRGLLYEFGITVPKGQATLRNRIPEVLEDAENELPDAFRKQLAELYQAYLSHSDQLAQVEKSLSSLVASQAECKRLMELEGVGPVNALGLYLAIGAQGGSFQNGREAAACIGLTPKQYSTDGVVTLGRIGKQSGNKRLRSKLIQGALSVVKVIEQRVPRNHKEAWLKALIERCGKRRAAVALANKTTRTAWAMLKHEENYQAPKPLPA